MSRREVEARLRLGDGSIGAGMRLRKLTGSSMGSKVHLVLHGAALCKMNIRHSRSYSNVSMAELVGLFGFDIFCLRCVDRLAP